MLVLPDLIVSWLETTVIQVFAIEFVAFAIEFAIEFVGIAIEFV